MQTRRRACPYINNARDEPPPTTKRRRTAAKKSVAAEEVDSSDYFDTLPDDLVISILSKLSSTATSPADLINTLITCKKMNKLGHHTHVLRTASAGSLAVRAKNWSESALRFLNQCADAGNLEACYTLGMIQFYCLGRRQTGANLMARAALRSHAEALYSVAVIQFNGSGGFKNDKNLPAGAALCAWAASLGHVDAFREFGHCVQDGYGVRQDVTQGRRFLAKANTRELIAFLRSSDAVWQRRKDVVGMAGCPLLSDYGYSVPLPEAHPANRFLVEWFGVRGGDAGGEGLRLCSHSLCGRPETRPSEFRRCSVCGTVSYCSRACQAIHWKFSHKKECTPREWWVPDAAVVADPPEARPTTR